MSNFFIDIAAAVSNTDDSLRNSYIKTGTTTIQWAFVLMQLQSGWQKTLDNDTIQAVLASMQPSGAGMAAYWQSQYQIDTQTKESQCSPWENMLQAEQTGVDNIADQRKSNFSIAQGEATTASQINNDIISF